MVQNPMHGKAFGKLDIHASAIVRFICSVTADGRCDLSADAVEESRVDTWRIAIHYRRIPRHRFISGKRALQSLGDTVLCFVEPDGGQRQLSVRSDDHSSLIITLIALLDLMKLSLNTSCAMLSAEAASVHGDMSK